MFYSTLKINSTIVRLFSFSELGLGLDELDDVVALESLYKTFLPPIKGMCYFSSPSTGVLGATAVSVVTEPAKGKGKHFING